MAEKANLRTLLFILQKVVILNDFTGLSAELAGTKAGDFLDRALERKSNTRTRIENEQIAKKIKAQKRVQKSIWGAIKRRYITAIPHLLSKNLDLNEIGPAGISLRECLKQIELV